MKGFIEPEKYKGILEEMAIPCVDLVIRHEGKLLLVLRDNEPEKGNWFFPGGRIFKEETIEESAMRKLKQELNLTGRIIKRLGAYDYFGEPGPFGVSKVHTVNALVLVDVDDISDLQIDDDHSAYELFSELDENWHPYMKDILKDCGFFTRKESTVQ